MQIYAVKPSFLVDQSFDLAVTPNSTFGLALFRQDASASLTAIGRPTVLASSGVQLRGTTPRYHYFQSTGSLGPRRYDTDWGWPSVSLRLSTSSEVPRSAVYVAVSFPVDTNGNPTDRLGQAVKSGAAITPIPTDSDSMALLVGRPSRPTTGARIAYIVPIATYHAYNLTGGGCFYPYAYPSPAIAAVPLVTMRRPGGGLGAVLREPADPYDPSSPRQQYPHWDGKFIAWLNTQRGAGALWGIDYYTDLDLHAGIPQLQQYRVVVSAGHHEYWSQQMRDNLQAFLNAGGNYACFSGNTCYRPIDFGSGSQVNTVVHKRADSWSGFSESNLIGLSYGYGGGKWGTNTPTGWTDTGRTSYGLVLRPGTAGHWAFSRSGLPEGGTLGGASDYLVGYEADGVPPSPPSSLKVLAQSPPLTGFNEGATNRGAMIIKNDPGGGRATNAVFNAGTTDWARLLVGGGTTAMQVAVVTLRVLTKFAENTQAETVEAPLPAPYPA